MSSETEYHVASFVAHASPKHSDTIVTEINKILGAEVHAVSDEGKIVFTVEAENQKQIAANVDHIRLHDKLLSLSPIYHQFLSEKEPS